MKLTPSPLVPNFAALALAASLAVAAPAPARAAQPAGRAPLGLGAVFGEPTGFSAKYWLGNPDQAIDAGLSYSFDDFLLVYADYLFHFPTLMGGRYAESAKYFKPYAGVGAMVYFSARDGKRGATGLASSSSDVGLAARIPLGLEWMPEHAPLGIFLEIVPGFGVVPATFGFLQGGIGARFYLP
jgi:hypothetical protein